MRNNINRGGRQYQSQQKEKKSYAGIIMIIVILVITIGSVWIWYGNRGAWVCKNGEWVMQGETDKEKPTKVCKGKVIVQSQDRQKPDAKMVKLDSEKVAEGIDIRVKTPHVNATVSSPIQITGEAKDWYVEGAFSVELIDATGEVIGMGTAKIKGDENLDEYVDFNAEIKFKQGDAKSGDIIFYRSDPTGESKSIGTFSFPVFFE